MTVEQAIEDLNKAMLAADGAKLKELLSDSLSYGHSSGKVESKADVLDVVGNRKTIYHAIKLEEATVKVTGSYAIARNIFVNTTETAGKKGDARVGVLMVWVIEGGWKLAARQAFKLA